MSGPAGKLRGLDLFSGIGGLTLALEPWVRPIAYCERDRYAQAVLLSRMATGDIPVAPIWDDVTTLSPDELAAGVDIIYGGFPCQDISIAGAGAGLGGDRSKLFFEIIRLARELRPRFLFLENVPAITLRGLDRILLDLTALGYDCRWTIVSAAEVGAMHLRERWWLCAYSHSGGLQVAGSLKDEEGERRREARNPALSVVQGHLWSEPVSLFRRGDDGLPGKIHRIRALGNAVVPLQARTAFARLCGIEGEA